LSCQDLPIIERSAMQLLCLMGAGAPILDILHLRCT
jgi:hypothetical protein